MPLAGICLAITDVFYNYSKLPAGTPFEWFLIRSGYLITGVAGVLVIAEYFFKAETFRKITRLTTLLVLLYGGFMFRQSQSDYEKMLERRRDQTPGIMNIKETVPVMKSDNRLTYLPSAPCRFSADGGYVQGCNMELAQRFMQLDFAKIRSGDPSQNALMGRAAGAFLVIIIMVFIGARWWCGWICPLATLGDVFDFFRRRFGLPCYKPSRPVKLTCLISGLSVGGFGLLLAKAYANIDSDGKFMGCKIPLYPFCKICPGQQVCPVASRGPMAYTPLPGWEWLFGFFRMGVILLLVFFVISFAASRRLWCRFCPMGMLGGLFNRGGLMALKKNPLKCNGCGICNEVCPMDIHLVQKEMEKEDVSSFDCVYCLKCVNKCPQDDCLSMEFAGHKVLESKFRD
jgi:NAD-dependent dihydropyrimidine dehydrogenase PreA subunit